MTKRGGLFTVSLPVDYGKPRPALVIQNDLLNELDSLVLCPVSSNLRTAEFRVTVEPSAENGLRQTSQVMVDKLSTLPRSKVGETFGLLEVEKMRAVDRDMMLVIGVI